MKATIYDVAREAGVSIATVSKVINSKGKISEERRREIFAIMERLQYQPSVIASALTGKHTYTLGLLIPDIANPFFGEVARAVEDRGHQLGYSVIICSTDNKDERIEQYLSVLKQKRVDGIMIGTGMGNADTLRELRGAMPVVAIGRELPAVPVHAVVADDRQGGRSAAEHLLLLGHRRMAVLSEGMAVSSSRDRLHGFRQKLEEEGVPLPERHVRPCKHRIEHAKREAAVMLEGSDRPTAIFCCNDLLAVGALQAAKEAGIKVPGELSVVSFDNTVLASVTDPPLTSVAQPMERIGAAAVDLLLEQFGQGAAPARRRVTLRTELVVRASTALAPHNE
ncbi:LacI family DNA-binding transcriptional regulator [Paenibacillus arenilitoris]|uniref:LacI family DNA-binding transcriptional regulator n=1 Tax=Paenibacillus arenilitoris TaxID=2772299 RepID=A0A927CM28_9BACL|nr:LacI family DNA-binding transcriptional regulator [Paenibacillus arenilitoris]MBD2869317.1 LacI family DNA-binding transcriptional regulator [Paenibacillus arenilitoris]